MSNFRLEGQDQINDYLSNSVQDLIARNHALHVVMQQLVALLEMQGALHQGIIDEALRNKALQIDKLDDPFSRLVAEQIRNFRSGISAKAEVIPFGPSSDD